jgi:cytochrome P450
METVLRESLRYHQPVAIQFRTAMEDNTLVSSDSKQIHVYKGTDIILDLHILHR